MASLFYISEFSVVEGWGCPDYVFPPPLASLTSQTEHSSSEGFLVLFELKLIKLRTTEHCFFLGLEHHCCNH